jgi:hypothetical protein
MKLKIGMLLLSSIISCKSIHHKKCLSDPAADTLKKAQKEYSYLINFLEFSNKNNYYKSDAIQSVFVIERVTGLPSEFPLTGDIKRATPNDLKKWKRWYQHNKNCLRYNYSNMHLYVCDSCVRY